MSAPRAELAGVAQPLAGTVRDRHGNPCRAATADSYPLAARCHCGGDIRCADGTADWVHPGTRRGPCG